MSEEKQKSVPVKETDALVVDDGYISVPVYNQLREEIGRFRFNPTDVNIVNRYKEVLGKFADVLTPLQNAGVDAEGVGTDPESVDRLNEAEDKMIELMDYILGGDSREAFFSQVHMFAPVNGKFYIENVFEQLGAYISRKFDTEINRLETRLGKHTHGYRTGRHRKGRS